MLFRYRLIATLAVILSFGLLLYNAATNTFFDDEAGGFFFAKLSPSQLISMMAQNETEDPPLWYLISHFWIILSNRSVFLLRLLPLVFWLGTFPGVYLFAKRLTNPKVAWSSIALLALMPYNWIYPVSFRWYSMFTFLCVWNSYSLLEITHLHSTDSNLSIRISRTRRLLFCVVYFLTGSAMCYTNYVAGLFFAAHFIYILFLVKGQFSRLLPPAIVWFAIAVSFLPWLPNFFRQLGMSVQGFSIVKPAVTFYEMLGSPYSTPNALLITAGIILFGICSMALIFRCVNRSLLLPLCVLFVVLGAMITTSTLESKRALMLTPYFAVSLAIALNFPRKAICHKSLTVFTLLSFSVVMVGSLVKMIQRTDWISYRWLAPTQFVVEKVKACAPQALVITTSDTVLFYLGDDFGQFRNKFAKLPGVKMSMPKGYYFKHIDDVPLADANECVFLWEAGYKEPVSQKKNAIVQNFKDWGFCLYKTQSYLKMSDFFLKFHPSLKNASADPLDSMRFVVFYFKRITPV